MEIILNMSALTVLTWIMLLFTVITTKFVVKKSIQISNDIHIKIRYAALILIPIVLICLTVLSIQADINNRVAFCERTSNYEIYDKFHCDYFKDKYPTQKDKSNIDTSSLNQLLAYLSLTKDLKLCGIKADNSDPTMYSKMLVIVEYDFDKEFKYNKELTLKYCDGLNEMEAHYE